MMFHNKEIAITKPKTMLSLYQNFNTIMTKDPPTGSASSMAGFIRYEIYFATTLFEFIMEYSPELFFTQRNNCGNVVFVWNIYFCVSIMGVFIQTGVTGKCLFYRTTMEGNQRNYEFRGPMFHGVK